MLRQLSKRFFSTANIVAKIKYIPNSSIGKNVILFATENDISNCQSMEIYRKSSPLFIEDIKKTNSSLFYSNSEEYPSTDRVIVVKAPLDDLFKLRTSVANTMRGIKSYNLSEIDIKFSPSFPVHHRRIVLNASILANYESLEKGGIPLPNFGKKESKKSEETDTETKKEDEKSKGIQTINVLEDEVIKHNKNSLNLWIAMAKGALYTRTLANTRGSVGTPEYMEKEAAKIVKKFPTKIKMTVIKGEELKKKGMNLLYAVGQSAQSEPRMVLLEYRGRTDEKAIDHAIVGKGVTFDTGGLNLKPTGYIEDMYVDKHGSCNSLGVMMMIASLNLKVNVVCALALAENSIDSNSYKPGDIIKSYKGYTVEIGNTDAEGRLCLADTLTYVQEKFKPKKIIDIATLTGACMVALGMKTAGLFTNSESFSNKVNEASKEVLEPLWHLPITQEHRDDIKGKYGDICNSGSSRYGGASQAAAFLEHFVEKDTEWIHLDIAGPSIVKATQGVYCAGATGFATQTVIKYLYNDAYGTDVKSEEFHEIKHTNIEELIKH